MRTKEWLNFYPCCEWTTVRTYNNIRSSRYESPIVLIVDTIRRFVRGTSTFRFDYLRAGTNTQLWGGVCATGLVWFVFVIGSKIAIHIHSTRPPHPRGPKTQATLPLRRIFAPPLEIDHNLETSGCGGNQHQRSIYIYREREGERKRKRDKGRELVRRVQPYTKPQPKRFYLWIRTRSNFYNR